MGCSAVWLGLRVKYHLIFHAVQVSHISTCSLHTRLACPASTLSLSHHTISTSQSESWVQSSLLPKSHTHQVQYSPLHISLSRVHTSSYTSNNHTATQYCTIASFSCLRSCAGNRGEFFNPSFLPHHSSMLANPV